MRLLKDGRLNRPLLSLIVVNTIPLWGVLFLHWEASCIVFLYWAENLVVGFYNVLKMACANGLRRTDLGAKLFIIPFFMVHYGIFAAVHGAFVLALFDTTHAGFWGMLAAVKYALIALFLSHGVSFVDDYLRGRQYASVRFEQLMFSPYPRLVVLHVSILASAFFIHARRGHSDALPLLIILVLLKTALDAKLYLSSAFPQNGVQAQGAKKAGEGPCL